MDSGYTCYGLSPLTVIACVTVISVIITVYFLVTIIMSLIQLIGLLWLHLSTHSWNQAQFYLLMLYSFLVNTVAKLKIFLSFSQTIGGTITWAHPFWRGWWYPSNFSMFIQFDFAVLLRGNSPRKMLSCLYKNVHMRMFTATIWNSKKKTKKESNLNVYSYEKS